MNRRAFTRIAGAAVAASTFLAAGIKSENLHNSDINEILDKLIQTNDLQIPKHLKNQENDSGHKWHGGVKDGYGIFRAGSAAGFIKSLVCGYVSLKSEYYRSSKLVEPLYLAAAYLVNSQYEDGTIDLPSTNFHSTPDTAFVVEPVCIAYNLLKIDEGQETEKIREAIKTFLLRAGNALTVGGIHTPNHRWVVSMALARINAIFPNPKYLQRIDQWLGEGIDIDEDGQYHEKSTIHYTPLTNRCFITIARLTNKPELYKHVRRNLEMSLYYRHANGEIATESSGRQDKYQRGTMQSYYYPYRYMALLDDNKLFAGMALELEKTVPDKLSGWLGMMLEDDSWLKDLSKPASLPVDYYKEFLGSNIIRIRRKQVDASILLSNPTFFTFFNNKAALEAVRFASAFFGKGQFRSMNLNKQGKEIELVQELIGPYYQPMNPEDLPGDGDWGKMPRMKRPQSEVQHQESKVIIREDNGRFELEIIIEGTDNVPVAVELAFRKGGKLKGVVPSPHGIEDAYLSLDDVPIEYEFEGNKIQVSAGMQEHSWTQLRGALPKLDAMCVYLTGITPFRRTLKISGQ